MKLLVGIALLALAAQADVIRVDSGSVLDVDELVIESGESVEIDQTNPNGLVIIRSVRAVTIAGELRWNGDLCISPENSWRVPIPVQTQEPPCGTSAVLTTTCATTEALA